MGEMTESVPPEERSFSAPSVLKAASSAVAERSFERTTNLGERLWGLRWDAHFPLSLGDGVTVRSSCYSESASFMQARCSELFGFGDSPFSTGAVTEAKLRYFEQVADFFLIEEGGTRVGLFIGNPIDWSSYYLRVLAIEPSHQKRALSQPFFARLFAVLAHAGVERVDAEAALSNVQCLRLLTNLGFYASGTMATDRWGVLSRFTRYLSAEPEDVFLEQFCAGGLAHREWFRRGRPEAEPPAAIPVASAGDRISSADQEMPSIHPIARKGGMQ